MTSLSDEGFKSDLILWRLMTQHINIQVKKAKVVIINIHNKLDFVNANIISEKLLEELKRLRNVEIVDFCTKKVRDSSPEICTNFHNDVKEFLRKWESETEFPAKEIDVFIYISDEERENVIAIRRI